MKPRSLLFCGYCAVVILVPANPHPYTFILHCISWFITIFCHHFFRAFLKSGTPASKTVFHSLLWSLTVCYQLHYSVITFYTVLGNLFNASTEEFVKSHPGAACVLFTPRWSALPMVLYLFYLATLKLMIALKPYWLMGLNHDRLAMLLNISTIVITLADNCLALIVNGSTCATAPATLYLLGTTGLDNNFEPSTYTQIVPNLFVVLLIILLSIEYAVAEIIVNLSSIRAWFTRCRARISYHINQVGEDINANRDNNVFIVLPQESYGQSRQHNVPAINNFVGPQPLTHFQQMMILLKGMGFFAGLILLLVYILTYFFEISFIVLFIVSICGKLLFLCTPVYWVLVLDDVYELTKRRIMPFLTSVGHNFTDDQLNQQNIRRTRRVTPFIPKRNISPTEDDIPIAGPSNTSPKVPNKSFTKSQENRPLTQDDISIAGPSHPSLKVPNKSSTKAQENRSLTQDDISIAGPSHPYPKYLTNPPLTQIDH